MESELDLAGILRELVRGEVEFLVIGGVAVGFHGYIRATKDVDIVPAPHIENLEKLVSALDRLGARVQGAEEFEEEEFPDPLDPQVLAQRGNWVLETRLGLLDIMQWMGEQALWERLFPRSVVEVIGDLPIRFAGFEDLIAMKEEAGRPEDLADLKRLREATDGQ